MACRQRQCAQEGTVDTIQGGRISTLYVGLSGELVGQLPAQGVSAYAVQPEFPTGFVHPVQTCPIIDTATERPGTINAARAPVRFATDSTGSAGGDVMPRFHTFPLLTRSRRASTAF